MTNLQNNEFINNYFFDENNLLILKEKFKEFGYVKLHNLFDEKFLLKIKSEVNFLSKNKCQRDFIMPNYNTPRTISILGGGFISENSPLLLDLYKSKSLKDLISNIVGDNIFNIDHPEECIVINFLEKKGDTHGWHLDDPRYALVMIIEAPKNSDSGYLEIIEKYNEYSQKKGIDPIKGTSQLVKMANDEGLIRKITHMTGECYLLNAADCLHRVAPVDNDTHRTVINYAFDNKQNIKYGNTANILYNATSNYQDLEHDQ